MRKLINNIIENVDVIAAVTAAITLFALACSSACKWHEIVSLI